jgi:hypothetical protein
MTNTESGRHADFGSIGTYHCKVGIEYDVPADLAKSWITAGVATETASPAAVAETQVATVEEKLNDEEAGEEADKESEE